MKNRLTKAIFAILLVLSLSGSIFEGCQISKTSVQKSEITGVLNNQTGTVGFKKLKEPVKLKFVTYEHPSMSLSSDALLWQEIFKRTNIKIELVPIPYSSDYLQEISIMMASGEYGDILTLDIQKINEYGDKLFVPLDKLIESQGPNLAKLLVPDVKIQVLNDDGKVYGMPLLSQIQPDYIWMLRKDYLNAFKLEEPDTIEDWEEFWRLVKESDLDGNGKKDTIPLAPRGAIVLKMNVFPIFGLNYSDFYLKDGKFVYAWTTQNCREAITWLNKIYEEGLLYEKYPLMNANVWEEMVASGKVVSTQGPPYRVSAFNSGKREENAEFEMLGVAPPKGPRGDRGIKPLPPVNTRVCMTITKNCKNIDAAFKFMDYFYSDEGSVLSTWGVEGATYNVKNGKKVWSKEMMENRNNYSLFAHYGIMLFLFPRRTDPGQTELLMAPDSAVGIAKNEKYYQQTYPVLSYTKDEAINRREINDTLTRLVYQYFNKFVMGEIPITDSTWSMFQNELEKMKVDELTKIENDAYARYKQRYDLYFGSGKEKK